MSDSSRNGTQAATRPIAELLPVIMHTRYYLSATQVRASFCSAKLNPCFPVTKCRNEKVIQKSDENVNMSATSTA